MDFCKDCSGMMLPKRLEDGTVVMECTKCGATVASDKKDFTIQTKKKTKKKVSKKETIAVIDEEEAMKNMASIEAECPKCDNKRALWWLVQTRGVDEPSTRFFRCTKSRHTWREYA